MEVRQQRHLERHVEFTTGPDGVQPRHIPLAADGAQGVVVILFPAVEATETGWKARL
jgi:hypothetical protein